MTQFFARKLNKKGFTLAELLIVVAIIAILIAVAIPIYTGAMQEAQKKVNMSNERSLKGAATSFILTNWTGTDANSKKYSTGADKIPDGSGGDPKPAPGWYAWAWFDDDGTMGTVHVAVDSETGHATGVASFEAEQAACPDDDLVKVSESGPVTNPNVIVVHLSGTEISK